MSDRHFNLQNQIRAVRRMIFILCGICLIVLVCVLMFVPVDERILAVGRVRAAEDTYLHAPEDGILEKVYAYEGETVKAGDPIVALDDSAYRARLKQIEASLEKARADIDFQKAKLEKTLKLPLPREFWHMQEELGIAHERLKQTEVEYSRAEDLHNRGLISTQEVERSRLSVELARAEVEKAREKLGILDKGLEDTIVREATAEIMSAQAELRRLEVERSVCQEAMEKLTLRAPADGVVTLILKRRTGEKVERGEDLAHVSHGPPERVDLFAGENGMHRIRPGQKVLMESRAFDKLRHGYIRGTVVRVPMEPENAEEGSIYRVVARVDESPQELVLGSTVEARIILQRVPLWKLLLPETLRGEPDGEPHSAFPEKVEASHAAR